MTKTWKDLTDPLMFMQEDDDRPRLPNDTKYNGLCYIWVSEDLNLYKFNIRLK